MIGSKKCCPTSTGREFPLLSDATSKLMGETMLVMMIILGLVNALGCGQNCPGTDSGESCPPGPRGEWTLVQEPFQAIGLASPHTERNAGQGSGNPVTQESATVLEVFIDISEPMGGFAPAPNRAGATSAFSTLVRSTGTHLARVYRDSNSRLTWLGVGGAVEKMPSRPRVVRETFDGRDTRLDLAIDRIMANLQTGRASGTAIITDLMATGGSGGPIEVLHRLHDWLESASVRDLDIHLGLLGVKLSYTGIYDRCTATESRLGLGCWFHEGDQQWKPVTDASQRTPIYVILLGREADKVSDVLHGIEEAVYSADKSIKDHRLLKAELTTSPYRDIDPQLTCRPLGKQYTLARHSMRQGYFRVENNTEVTFACTVSNDLKPLNPRTSYSPTGDVDIVDVVVHEEDDDGLYLTMKSGRIAQKTRETTGTQLALSLQFDAVHPFDWDVNWHEWNSDHEQLGYTLELDDFIEELRFHPPNYAVTFNDFMKFCCY